MTQLASRAFSERHYEVSELAALWNLSEDTIRRLFRNEPGVLVLGRENRPGKRRYSTLRVPESVARQVRLRLSLSR
jgi:transcriptional regulator GlxA family with amidase domain